VESSCEDVVALLTVGHGTAGRDELVGLFRDAGVTDVVDVRRFPGSRRHPHVAREEMRRWLPEAGIGYRWDERLGGRRRPDPASPHRGLRNEQFRAYADHMETPAFAAALGELLSEAAEGTVAAMCSESVWWRCHRRLISDRVQLLHGEVVRHLMHDGRLQPHVPTDVVRAVDGRLLYGPPQGE
jgi:uncharacterized protein (DUF488 family)